MWNMLLLLENRNYWLESSKSELIAGDPGWGNLCIRKCVACKLELGVLGSRASQKEGLTYPYYVSTWQSDIHITNSSCIIEY